MIEDDFYPAGSLAGRAMPMGSQTGPLGTYTAWVVGRRGDAYVVRRLFWDPTPERNVTDPGLSLAHADLS